MPRTAEQEKEAMRLLANLDYRHLLSAQVIALFGTGLTTIALGLFAYELAGPRASVVLGTVSGAPLLPALPAPAATPAPAAAPSAPPASAL